MPMFSIIIPVYNAAEYLADMINDVLRQTYAGFELLLVDDGSTDSSAKICDGFERTDERVRVFHLPNGGISQARNFGLQAARHEYVCFFDDDDRISPDFLEKAAAYIRDYSPDLLCCGSRIIHVKADGRQNTSFRRLPFFICRSNEELFEKYYQAMFDAAMLHCVWDKVYKRELLERSGVRFDESFTHGGEDLCFNLKLVGHINRIVNTESVFYDYFMRELQSTVCKFNPHSLQQGFLLTALLRQISAEHPEHTETGSLYDAYCLNIVSAAAQLGRKGAPHGILARLRFVRQSFRADPFDKGFKSRAAAHFRHGRNGFSAKGLVACAVHGHYLAFILLQTVLVRLRGLGHAHQRFRIPFPVHPFGARKDRQRGENSRSANSVRNILYGVGGQFLSLLLGFANRSIFIYTLGVTYLGVNGLFSNLLSLLSFAELGIGSAITYSLYKPLKEKDTEQIKTLMRLYARAYRAVGCTICVVGLAMTPFLDMLIKDRPNIPHLQLYYLLMLAGTVATYFFTYKRSIILADQKGYLNTWNMYAFAILQSVVQMVFLITLKNYILYLATGIVLLVASNISISHKADRIYPFLRDKNVCPLSGETKTEIIKNTAAMVLHKVGGAVNASSDNIIISAFTGLVNVGIYSNYFLILNTVQSFIAQVFNSMLSSVANLLVTSDKDRSYALFNKLNFANFWIDCFCTTCLWVLLNPFILVWLHNREFLFSGPVLLVLVINFYQLNFHHTPGVFINSAGLFWKNRFKPVFECGIKISVSILLIGRMGILGDFLGTLCSFLLTSFWVEAFILYKNMFHRSFWIYLGNYAVYAAVVCSTALVTGFICGLVPNGTLGFFLLKAALCVLIVNGILLLLFFKTRRFRECIDMLRPLIQRLSHANSSFQ